jgi:hypothetical protein
MKSLSVLYLVILALCIMMVRVATAAETGKVVISAPVITMHPGVRLKGLVCNDGTCDVSVDGPTIQAEMHLAPNLNKEFILAKRATIAKDRPDLAGGDTPISENDALSRDFFSIIMSLQQSGTLDQNSIQAVSEAIGKKVEATPIDDIYTRNMVKVVESNPDSISNYYEAFINLVIKYGDKNIGDELIFINQGLVNKDPNAIKQINSISKAYRDFGAEFIKIPVPNTLVNPHISLANNYEKVGQSIVGMTNLLGDPLSGIKSFINYKKYSDALETDIDGISGN